jgi:hypothetical protein
MNTKLLTTALIVALCSSAATLVVDHLVLHPPYAMAQEAQPQLQDFVFYAQHRRDTAKDESFFFFNPKTGDIYVYQEGSAKEHYRVVTVGEDFEKLR